MFCTDEFDPYEYDDYHDNDKVVAQQLRDDFVYAANAQGSKEEAEVNEVIQDQHYQLNDFYCYRFKTVHVDDFLDLQNEYQQWFDEIAMDVAKKKYKN